MSKLPIKGISFQRLDEQYRSAAIQLLERYYPEVDPRHIRSIVDTAVLTKSSENILYGAIVPEKKLVGVCLTQSIPVIFDRHFGFGVLTVDENYRKRRVGTRLTRFALRYLRESVSRHGTVILSQGEMSSEAFYQRLGFRTAYKDLANRPIMVRSIAGHPLDFSK